MEGTRSLMLSYLGTVQMSDTPSKTSEVMIKVNHGSVLLTYRCGPKLDKQFEICHEDLSEIEGTIISPTTATVARLRTAKAFNVTNC